MLPFRRRSAVDLKRESELVARCVARDDAAWEVLVGEHTRRVYRLCYRFTRNTAAAEDLTQEVFLRVFRALGSFRASEATFATWLTQLTRNLLVDHYRRTRDDRVTSSFEDQPKLLRIAAHGDLNPERACAVREARDLVQLTLAMLEPELREPIVYRDLEEMNYREIALTVGIPVGTVKSRLNRARTQLARLTLGFRTAA